MVKYNQSSNQIGEKHIKKGKIKMNTCDACDAILEEILIEEGETLLSQFQTLGGEGVVVDHIYIQKEREIEAGQRDKR